MVVGIFLMPGMRCVDPDCISPIKSCGSIDQQRREKWGEEEPTSNEAGKEGSDPVALGSDSFSVVDSQYQRV